MTAGSRAAALAAWLALLALPATAAPPPCKPGDLLVDCHSRAAAARQAVAHAVAAAVEGLPGLVAPVAGMRLTSAFGWRRHPITGQRAFHYGIDIAAPAGTPVLAPRDGWIEEQGWHGGYGRYLRLRHSEHLETGYGHLMAFAPRLHPGSLVRQGELIGYVGATGVATGPHLDWQVMIDHHKVDPLKAVSGTIESATPAPEDPETAELRRWLDAAALRAKLHIAALPTHFGVPHPCQRSVVLARQAACR